MRAPRIAVDQDVCQAAGYCVRTAPAVFMFGADGLAAVRDPHGRPVPGPVDVPAEQVADVDTAAWDCPSGAITLTRD
ncbi:ferredoxin [Nocardia otitidiscaviarum]|uniref:ferredoxin n=1 Tax=Nocardia otitidiscaviarum TaxID=1823 RepID=UPI001895569E|nr:ferredoxin [Nocardia otitidiscaviarum]MBF6180087.1 ferredoxin [Nocardia otitidiscaviarum]